MTESFSKPVLKRQEKIFENTLNQPLSLINPDFLEKTNKNEETCPIWEELVSCTKTFPIDNSYNQLNKNCTPLSREELENITNRFPDDDIYSPIHKKFITKHNLIFPFHFPLPNSIKK